MRQYPYGVSSGHTLPGDLEVDPVSGPNATKTGQPAKTLTLSLPVVGMTCAACASRVEKSLARLDGVRRASVNLATERASVELRAGAVDVTTLTETIKKIGYDVPQAKARLAISGMTCANCAARIEKRLRKEMGVTNVSVNLATDSATVDFIPGVTDVPSLIRIIESLGYKADDAEPGAMLDAEQKAPEKEIRSQRNRFLFSAALSLPLLLSMLGHTGHIDHPILQFLNNGWVQLALATPVQFIAGWPFYVDSYHNLRNRSANMSVLVATGTSAAYVYSLASLFAGERLGIHGYYFETSAVLITLILLGKLLEARAKGRTSEAIKHLMGLQPKTARVIRDGEIRRRADRRGGRGRCRPGPAGGKDSRRRQVIEGHSTVDESMLTGESIPWKRARATRWSAPPSTSTAPSPLSPPRWGATRPRPDHPRGAGGSRLQSADPAPGRRGLGILCPRRRRRGPAHLFRLDRRDRRLHPGACST